MSRSSLRRRLLRLTFCALCLSIAIVLTRFASFYIPLFGQNGMKVGLSGIFSSLPSYLFGPVYGAIVSGLSDLLGWVVNPGGAYIPVMTLCIALGGFIRGGLWLLIRDKNGKWMRVVILVVAAALLAFGAWNFYALDADGVTAGFYDENSTEDIDTSDMHFISRMIITRTINTKSPSGNISGYITTMTWGIAGSGILAFLTLVVDLVIMRFSKKEKDKSRFLAVFIAMLVSGIVVTTINTVILRELYYEAWKLLPFMVLWLPRLVEEIVSSCVKSYFIAALLGVSERTGILKKLEE